MNLVPLGEVAKFVNGRAFKPEEWESKGLPIIRIQNLTGSTNIVNYYSGEFEPKHLVKNGDILISWSASLGVYIWNGEDAILNQHIFKVIPNQGVDKRYFYYAASHVLDDMLSKVHGTTMQHITKEPFEETKIPLPPLDEQQRIAAILQKADRVRQLRRYARSMSESVLQGVFLEMFGDPLNPSGIFEIKTLEEILDRIDSGWSPVCEETIAGNFDWGVLKLSSVTSGKFLQNENKKLPSNLNPRQDIEVRQNDILVTRKNTVELVAACCFVFETRPLLMLSDTIFRFVIKKNANLCPEYLWQVFSAKQFRKRVQALASGSADSMPNISKEKFYDIKIPIPPLGLQKNFAQIVWKSHAISQQQAESERQAEHLFQSLLKRAFAGQL